MNERVENGAVSFKPDFAYKVRRWLGFRYHLGVDPEGVDSMPGWFVTTSRFHFTFADRLRLLVSGRLYVRNTCHADAKVDTVKSRLDWQILTPGEKWGQ